MAQNYSFVIDSSFQPFTMQEMLMPFTAYKEAFEKAEEGYSDISKQAGDFEYLRNLPEDSVARQVYEDYADYLKSQFEDFSRNGLSMRNRRGLSSLKRRFQGEIGRLIKADEALKEEKKYRRAALEKDSSMLYAHNNLTLDDFMDGRTPNLYGVSGNELYTRGAAIGKAESSRIYSTRDGGSTLGGYYRKWVESQGYTAEDLNKWGKEIRENFVRHVSTLPELQERADALLAERGVTQNLTGVDLERARMSVINGILDGAITARKDTPMQDQGVLTAAQAAADRREGQRIAISQQELALRQKEYNDARAATYEIKNGKVVGYKPGTSSSRKSGSGGSRGGSGSSVDYGYQPNGVVMFGAKSGILFRDSNDKNSKYGTPIDISYGRQRPLSSGEVQELYLNEKQKQNLPDDPYSYSFYRINKDYVMPTGTDKENGYKQGGYGEDVILAIPKNPVRVADYYMTGSDVGAGSADNSSISGSAPSTSAPFDPNASLEDLK